MSSNHLIFCHRLLFLPSIFPSIRVFSSELALCIRQPKYCNFNFSISPSNEFLPLNMPPKLVKKQKGQSWKRISQSSNANVPPPTSHIPGKSHQPMINSKSNPQRYHFAACGPVLNLGWGRPSKRPACVWTQSRNCYMLCQFSYNMYQSVQFSSVAQSCSTLCDPMNCSMPHLPVHHHHPEFSQTHVHRVGDALQPSHPLSSPSPPAPNPSQHQSLFQYVLVQCSEVLPDLSFLKLHKCPVLGCAVILVWEPSPGMTTNYRIGRWIQENKGNMGEEGMMRPCGRKEAQRPFRVTALSAEELSAPNSSQELSGHWNLVLFCKCDNKQCAYYTTLRVDDKCGNKQQLAFRAINPSDQMNHMSPRSSFYH